MNKITYDKTGCELLKWLISKVRIVFLTGHIWYAIKEYDVNVLRCLTKPADEQKSGEVIDRVPSKQELSKMIWVYSAYHFRICSLLMSAGKISE